MERTNGMVSAAMSAQDDGGGRAELARIARGTLSAIQERTLLLVESLVDTFGCKSSREDARAAVHETFEAIVALHVAIKDGTFLRYAGTAKEVTATLDAYLSVVRHRPSLVEVVSLTGDLPRAPRMGSLLGSGPVPSRIHAHTLIGGLLDVPFAQEVRAAKRGFRDVLWARCGTFVHLRRRERFDRALQEIAGTFQSACGHVVSLHLGRTLGTESEPLRVVTHVFASVFHGLFLALLSKDAHAAHWRELAWAMRRGLPLGTLKAGAGDIFIIATNDE